MVGSEWPWYAHIAALFSNHSDHCFTSLFQRLPRSTLNRFKLDQSKARYMPMHLHAAKLVLPNYWYAGRDLTLSAKLPTFFSRSIKILKFWRKWRP